MTTTARKVCRHPGCDRPAQHSRRGLCYAHHGDAGVRAMYPPGSANPRTARYAKRSPGCGSNADKAYQCVHCERVRPTKLAEREPGWAEQRVRVGGYWFTEVCCPAHAALGFPPVVPLDREPAGKAAPLPEEWAPARRAAEAGCAVRAGWVAAGGGRMRA